MATASPQSAFVKSNLACPQFSCLRPHHGLDQSLRVPSSFAHCSRDVISIAGTGKISSFMPSMDSMTNQAIFEAGVCSQGFLQFAFGSHCNPDDMVSSWREEAKNGNVSTSGEDFNELYGPKGLNSVVPGVLAKGFDRIFDDMGLRMSIEVIHSIDEVKSLLPTDGFVCLLEQCMRERDLAAGRKVHCLIVRSGLEADALMGSHLIRMFAFFEHLLEANQVLSKLFQPNAFSWSTIIMAHTKVGENEQALKLYHQMQLRDVEPDGHVFVAVLKACMGIMASKEGMWVHGHIIIHGLESDMFVASTLVDMYAKCDSPDHLQNVFDRLPERNVLVWNVLILSYAKRNHTQKAFQLFNEMQSEGMEPDHFTYVCMLKMCSRVGALEQGRQIFSYIVGSGLESDIFVGSTMIDMYAKCGCPEDGHILFNRLPNRDVVTWNSLMSGYLQHGSCLEVLKIFDRLQNECMKPNSVTFVFILKACSSLAALEQGILIHAQVIESGFESDFCVGNTLVDMYAKCGSFEDAHVVFDRLPKLDIISWSVLIAGYTDSGHGEKALQVFVQLQQNSIEPDVSILISILKACANLETVEQGKLIHTSVLKVGLESEVSVCNALIDMYAKSGSVEDAHRVFDGLPERDVVTWTALIGGYAQHDQGQEALQIYKKMQEEGIKPDSTTFVCVLKACPSAAASIEQGRQVHADIIENGLESNVYVSSTLVDMYTKCGSLENAGSVLDRLPKGNTVTWNAYLAGCSLQGKGEKALGLFQKMQQEGLKPSSITFISVLKACAGILTLEQGRQIHACIIDNGFGSDEYVGSTLIDMYFECGCVDSACIVFDGFSTKNVVAWNTMFGGYAKHDHGQLALQLFQQMLLEGMDPDQVTFICILKACANMAALEQGRQMHCHIISRGFEFDVVVSCALLTMYAKCGSLEDGSMLFNRLPRHNVAMWNMMIGGYTQHISSSLALQYYDDLKKVGLKPDYVTFIHLIVACNRMGLSDTACLHFKKMRDEHGITPRLEHHNAMVDLLGHAGCLDQAQDLLETIPFENNLIGWTSLLNSCRMYDNADLGKQCFDRIMALDDCNAAGYALMSKLYEHAGMWDDAERVEQLRKNINGWKKPAKAFIEVDKKVHQFIVGDKTHPKSGDIYAKLNALSVQSRENGYKPQSDRAYADKEDATCGHCERLAIAFGLTCTAQGTTIRVAKNLRMCADCHVATKTISLIEMREIFVNDASRLHHFKEGECSCIDCF